MQNTIKIQLDYAKEKGIYVEDIVKRYLDGLLTIEEYYNCLAKRIKSQFIWAIVPIGGLRLWQFQKQYMFQQKEMYYMQTESKTD